MFLKLDNKLELNKDVIQSPNLCDRFTDDDLDNIGAMCWRGYQADLTSRNEWQQRNEAGMDLAMQVQKTKMFPWPGCANVVFPLVTIAALQFSARSYSNIIQGSEVVKYRTVGEDPTAEILSIATRIGQHMSWQVLEQDSAWEEEHDRLLIHLSIVGSAFLKTRYSAKLRHNVSELVQARDFVLNYYARSVDDCARKTHVIPLHRNDIYERVQEGAFRDVLDADWYKIVPGEQETQDAKKDQRSGSHPPPLDEDTPLIGLEQHRLLDLDGDGYAEPYIVTVEKTTHNVLRIVSRVDSDNQIDRHRGKIHAIRPTEYFTKFPFIPSPDGSIYDIGFGVLLGPLNEAVNTGINQMLDHGTMSSSSGGFLGRGAKIRGGSYAMAPWEWLRVESTGDDLRKSLVPLPVREPSSVMFQLLNLLINYTDRVSGTTDAMVGINPGQNTPAETSRNMLEQGMQVYNTIFKRVWRSMKEEFKKLHQLNSVYLPARVKFGARGNFVLREDYRTDPNAVVPVADPSVTSDAMRFNKAQAIRQAAKETPGYDMVEVERNFLKAMRVEGIEKFYPGPDKAPPPPSPQAQVEALKAKTQQMKFDHEKLLFALNLMEERRVNTAQIIKLQAEAEAILAGIQTDEARVRAEVIKMSVEALQTHHDIVNDRITALLGGGGGDDEGNGGGPGGMEGPPDDSDTLPDSAAVAGGAEGPVGSEGV